MSAASEGCLSRLGWRLEGVEGTIRDPVGAGPSIASGAKGESAAPIAAAGWRGEELRSGVAISGTQEVRPEEEAEFPPPAPRSCCRVLLAPSSSSRSSSLCRSGSEGAGVRSSEEALLRADLSPAGGPGHSKLSAATSMPSRSSEAWWWWTAEEGPASGVPPAAMRAERAARRDAEPERLLRESSLRSTCSHKNKGRHESLCKQEHSIKRQVHVIECRWTRS
jgi:hypothetical protein